MQLKRDARHRLRRRLRHRKVVVLVALGLWPDGRHQVPGWTLAENEGTEAWQNFLLTLHQRGLTPENGFRLAIGDGAGGLKEGLDLVYCGQLPFQLCHFHKIRRIVHRDYLGDADHRQEPKMPAMSSLAAANRKSTIGSKAFARSGKTRNQPACAVSSATSPVA